MQQYTKLALEESLKKLLLNKPLNKITVNDIIEDCGISRTTFYYHFKDIYDLVDWACLEDARKALEGKMSYDTWQQGFLQILYEVRENKPFIMNVYRCVSREQVERFLNPLVDSLIMEIIDDLSDGLIIREEDAAFIAKVYSYAFVGLLVDWVKGNMREEPKQLVDKFSMVIHGNISTALDRFRIDRNYRRK